jgi:hypothetical protein
VDVAYLFIVVLAGLVAAVVLDGLAEVVVVAAVALVALAVVESPVPEGEVVAVLSSSEAANANATASGDTPCRAAGAAAVVDVVDDDAVVLTSSSSSRLIGCASDSFLKLGVFDTLAYDDNPERNDETNDSRSATAEFDNNASSRACKTDNDETTFISFCSDLSGWVRIVSSTSSYPYPKCGLSKMFVGINVCCSATFEFFS